MYVLSRTNGMEHEMSTNEYQMITNLSKEDLNRAFILIAEEELRMNRGMNDLAHCNILEVMDVLKLNKVQELQYDFS